MSETLKPCPFCGEEAAEYVDGALVVCLGCGATMYGDDPTWNRRPREERLEKLLGEARKHVNRTTLSCVDRHLGDAGCPIGYCYRIGSETCDARDLLAAIDAELGERP